MNQQEELLAIRRKRLLTVAILSIVNIGYGILGQIQAFIIGKLSPEKVEEMIKNTKNAFVGSDLENQFSIFDQLFDIERINNHKFFLSHGIAMLGLLLGLAGVIMMLKRKSMGFQLYIIYSILTCFGLFLYVPFNTIPSILVVTNVIFSLLMILLYHRNRTWDLTENQEE